MKWSFRLATIAGTQVRIHLTFLLLIGWVGLSFFLRDGALAAVYGMGFFLALFFCVLLHEFGHVLAARRYGITTPDITLLPIGGIARLSRMPRTPSHELVVALAGPAVNVVIAGLLFLVVRVPAHPSPEMMQFKSFGDLLFSLMVINIWLVVFNMIPAFPMDGGRVLRAILAMTLPYGRATATASIIGQVIAGAGAILALMIWHPLLLLIAIFIFLAARAESSAVTTQEALQDLPLERAMITNFRSLDEGSTLRDAVDALLAGSQHDFPVLDGGRQLVGILTRSGLIAALASHGPHHPVSDVMLRDAPSVPLHTTLRDAFALLQQSPSEVLPVLGLGDEVSGLLSTENISELLMVRSAVSAWQREA
jgi:stage IV sporulation protein FB